jgi:hypothetical protein
MGIHENTIGAFAYDINLTVPLKVPAPPIALR